MKIYYAHSVSIYNTEQERRDIKTLTALGFDVESPNQPHFAQGYMTGGMAFFADIVSICDALAFRAHPDGSIPAGVAQEIKYATEAGRPVIELPSGVIRRTQTIEQTREYLREVGNR